MDWIEQYRLPEKAFGELVRSSHVGFDVQAYKYGYENNPEYGSIVVVNCGDFLTVGVIIGSEMTPAPGLAAMPTPMKATREQVQERYPDLEGRLLDIYEAVYVGYYSNGFFRLSRPGRKPLIHDLAYIPSNDFIKDLHKVSDGYTLDYFPLIIHALEPNELEPFADVYFAFLAGRFEVDERIQLYESLSASLAKWGDEARITEVINLAKRCLMEGV